MYILRLYIDNQNMMFPLSENDTFEKSLLFARILGEMSFLYVTHICFN